MLYPILKAEKLFAYDGLLFSAGTFLLKDGLLFSAGTFLLKDGLLFSAVTFLLNLLFSGCDTLTTENVALVEWPL